MWSHIRIPDIGRIPQFPFTLRDLAPSKAQLLEAAPTLGTIAGVVTCAGVTLYLVHRNKVKLLAELEKKLSHQEAFRKRLTEAKVETHGFEEKTLKPLQEEIWRLQGKKGKGLRRLSELEKELARKEERKKKLSENGFETTSLEPAIRSLEEEIQKLKDKLGIKPPPPRIEVVTFNLESEVPIYAFDGRVELGLTGGLFLIRNTDPPQKEPVSLYRRGFFGLKTHRYAIPTQDGVALKEGDTLTPLPGPFRFTSVGPKAYFETAVDWKPASNKSQKSLRSFSIVDAWPNRPLRLLTETGELFLRERGLHVPFLLREASRQGVSDSSRLMNRDEIERTLKRLDIRLPDATTMIKAIVIGRKAQLEPGFYAARTPLSMPGRDRHMIIEFDEAEACYIIWATDEAKGLTCLVRNEIPYRVPYQGEKRSPRFILEPGDTIILGGNLRKEEDPKGGFHYFSDASYRVHLAEGKGWLEFISNTQVPDAYNQLLSPSAHDLIKRQGADPNYVKEEIRKAEEEEDPLSRFRPVYPENIERYRRLCFFNFIQEKVLPFAKNRDEVWKLASDPAELNAPAFVWDNLTDKDWAHFWRGESEGIGPDGKHGVSLPGAFLRCYYLERMKLHANGSVPIGEIETHGLDFIFQVLSGLDTEPEPQESLLETYLVNPVCRLEAVRHLIRWQYGDLKWDLRGTQALEYCAGLASREIQEAGVPFLDASGVVSEALVVVIKKVVTSFLGRATEVENQGSEQEKRGIRHTIYKMNRDGLDLRAASESLLQIFQEEVASPTMRHTPVGES